MFHLKFLEGWVINNFTNNLKATTIEVFTTKFLNILYTATQLPLIIPQSSHNSSQLSPTVQISFAPSQTPNTTDARGNASPLCYMSHIISNHNGEWRPRGNEEEDQKVFPLTSFSNSNNGEEEEMTLYMLIS